MEAIWFLDTLAHIHIDGADTDGAYTLVECVAPTGHMPPPHVHADDAEGFHVLEGELTVHTDERPHVLRADDSIHAPARRPHTIEVTSETPCRWLALCAPAGFEAFVREFGVPAERDELPPTPDGPPDITRLEAVAAEHGITFVGPPGTTPAQLAAAGAA